MYNSIIILSFKINYKKTMQVTLGFYLLVFFLLKYKLQSVWSTILINNVDIGIYYYKIGT